MLLTWQYGFGLMFLLFLLVLAAGFIYARLGERRDLRLHPAPGRLVQVGGRRLHILCKGSAMPTVVIEQGAGELSKFWWPVQDAIAQFASVCTYDRAGFGWSDPVASPRTVEDRTTELHTLLKNAGMQGPYIFVAHSYGGLIVREYIRNYPAEAAGLVLVDTPDESVLFQQEVLAFYAKVRGMNRVVGAASKYGLLRLLGNWIPLDRYGFWLKTPAEYSALCDDLASLDRVPPTRRVCDPAGSLGSLPLIVITHGLPFPGPFAVLENHWREGQDRLAALSRESLLIVAGNSNHMIQQDEPELVIDAVRRMHSAINQQCRE